MTPEPVNIFPEYKRKAFYQELIRQWIASPVSLFMRNCGGATGEGSVYLEFNQFCEKIEQGLKEFYGEKVKIELQEIQKNNGVKLTGLLLTDEASNVAPAIYLEDFYKEYQRKKEIGQIILGIVRAYDNIKRHQKIDMDFFSDYNKVKDRVCFKLIHYERNRELLQQIPYIPYLNLAVVFYYAYENAALGKGTILIRHSQKEQWGISVEELFGVATENTRRLFPPRVAGIREVLTDMLGEKTEEEEPCLFSDMEEIPMYVLTNPDKMLGAAGLLYSDQLKRIADRLQSNLFILPSSVHEVILLPDCGEKPDTLQRMVMEVNDTQLAREEVLSDSVYYYDRSREKTEIVCE